MPLSTECRTAVGKRMGIADALKLTAKQRRELKCVKCGQRVSPHRESGSGRQSAHFEHLPGDGGPQPELSIERS